MRRILYFIATNAAIMAVMSVILLFLPAEFRTQNTTFLIFALVAGFGGSIVSLLMSKSMAKRTTGLVMIEEPRNSTEQWLIDTVARQAKLAGIGMPEVGIFQTPQMNAFATGANKNNALVAVSTGLLENMSREEAEAVMGHEIAHVANGDMITLTLIQGVVNVFVLYMARAAAMALGRNNRLVYHAVFMGGQIFFGFLASLIVAFFSRQREYRADTGGAKYATKEGMIGALEKLKMGQAGELPKQLAAFGINSGMKKFFSTHPPLDERINALRNQD